MSFGSGTYTKADYTRTVAATLAYFLQRQRDAAGLLTFDETIGEAIPPRVRSGHLASILNALEIAHGGSATDVVAPLEQIAATVSQRGIIVLMTDLLAPLDGLSRSLGYLCGRGHEVIVLRILDRREIDFSFDDAAMFRDAETGREVYIDPAVAAAEYRKNFDAHAVQLAELTGSLGVHLATLPTDEPVDAALFEFLAGRSHQPPAARRSRR